MITCEFNRRRFLQWTGAGAFATMATQLSWDDLANAANSSPLAASTPILVIVTLYGGNDGLNTVVPYTRPDVPERAIEHRALRRRRACHSTPAAAWDSTPRCP